MANRESWTAVLLVRPTPGSHRLEFELDAKVEVTEPWRQLSITGPAAAIATVTARANGSDTEIQLLGNALVEEHPATNSTAMVQGALGADGQLALRWQNKSVEVSRDAVVAVESQVAVRLSTTAARLTSQFRFDVLQSRVQRLRIAIPKEQSLTQFRGDQVRDWRLTNENAKPVLVVEFLRPIESSTTLTLLTEQSLSPLPATATLTPPEPLGVQRETGILTLAAEDVSARVEESAGLRQVNAGAKELAAYRFNSRPASVRATLTRIEPLLSVTDHVAARLEESRLVASHLLQLQVERAGIYALELIPATNFTVAEVAAEGLEDWKIADGRLLLNFRERVLGGKAVRVQLERSITNSTGDFALSPLAIPAAAKHVTWVGVSATPGISLKTAALEGIKEIPASALPRRPAGSSPASNIADASPDLAFRSEAKIWRMNLAAERLDARVVAEVFNLVTIGEGVVGGSATIRYGIANQGAQQFQVRVPAHWKNLEFTGPGIRRQDHDTNLWTLTLQDKVWGAYTLVLTYDYTFDPRKATLDAGGAHPVGAEREEGTVVITAAPGLTLDPPVITEPLRQIDPTELAPADHALINRPVLLAARYHGANFALAVALTRHEEVAALDAVADRAQLTSVLTDTGEMLTQASFMVKNNERQFQKFQLPAGATLWGVAVNGAPAKADRDGDWLLVPLPRVADRNQAFAVDIKYAQQVGKLGVIAPRNLELAAPRTDMPGTYAEWELFVSPAKRVGGFGGNMTVARGTVYGARDAWRDFIGFYRMFWSNHGAVIVFLGCGSGFLLLLIFLGRRRQFNGVVQALGICAVVAILGGMLLPSLAKAKANAQRIKSVNNLKNIGLAARVYATDHDNRLPDSFEGMMTELSTDRILSDPETGERYVYVGAGKSLEDPNAILAYSSDKQGHREVIMADGSVQQVNASRFADLVAKDDAGRRQPAKVPALAENRAPGEPEAITVTASDTAAAKHYGINPTGPKPALTALGAATPFFQGGPAATVPASAALPTATGVRSLSIEIPRSGKAFQFTKVLNLDSEPAVIRFSVMSARAASVLRTIAQLAGFIAGLVLVATQVRRARPRSLWLALGIVLALLSFADLLLMWRALHLLLIIGTAVLFLIAFLWVARRAFRAPAEYSVSDPIIPSGASTAGSTATAMLLAIGFLGGGARPAAALEIDFKTPAAVQPVTNTVSVVSASYTGSARERSAELDVLFELSSPSTNQTVALFGPEVAVRDFAVMTGEARLWRDGNRVGVLLPNAGAASIRARILARINGDVTRRQLAFKIPPALASRLSLFSDEADAEIEFPGAVSFQRAPKSNGTQLDAVLGATEDLQLRWTPRFKRAAEGGATVFVQQSAVVTFQNGMATTRSVLDYQVPQGDLQQLRVQLPKSRRLLRVSGETVRSWHQNPANHNELVVELLRGASPACRLELELEQSLG
ncbi:MAG TPA: hypothetical protein VHH73_17620, partial [Verrucomicrobiae bacterium]|nr:hypothetical protein [Verrucomicrobiae bacterium]